MAYPSSIDTDTVSAGSSTLSSPDHSTRHNTMGSAMIAIETVLGTTNGTSVLKNFAAGDFASRINSSNVLQQALQGTINNAILGTPSITGGTTTSQIINTATLGTPKIITPINDSNGSVMLSFNPAGTAVNYVEFTNAATGAPPQINPAGADTNIALQLGGKGTAGYVKVAKALTPTVSTLTDSAGGTIAVNAALAQVFELSLGTAAGNRTLASPSNAVEGQSLIYRVKQNSGNTGTIVFNAIYRFGQSGTPTLGTQSTWNYIAFRYNSTDTKWDHQGNSLGLI